MEVISEYPGLKRSALQKMTAAEGGAGCWRRHVNLFTSSVTSPGNVLINRILVCRLEPNAPYFRLII